MTSVSQYESTLWSSLIITVAASAYFFAKIFGAILADDPLSVAQVARLGLAIVIIIIAVEVAFSLVLHAWFRGEPQTDERDELIAAKSARNAYYVLITGIFILVGHAGIAALLGYIDALNLDVQMAITLAVFAMVVAEVTHYGSRIVYYRLGS